MRCTAVTICIRPPDSVSSLSLNGGTLGRGLRDAGFDPRKLDCEEGWPSGKALASKAKVGHAHRGSIPLLSAM